MRNPLTLLGMCTVWKWIMIVTAVPLVAIWAFGEPIFYASPDSVPRWLRRIPYSRAWWSACAIVVIAAVIYAYHCQ